jgi:hypothetical protein
MTLLDIATLALATWGAALSTFLGFTELRKQKRRLRVVCEYVAFSERAQLVIINVGHRPVTVASVSIGAKMGDDWESVPSIAMFDDKNPFPLTLSDGEHITLPLVEQLAETLRQDPHGVQVTVYDIEGTAHNEVSMRTHNPKWGSITAGK